MPRKRRDVPWLDTVDGVYYAHWYRDASRRTKRLLLGTRDPGEASGAFAGFLSKGKDLYRTAPAAGIVVDVMLDHYTSEHDEVGVTDEARIEGA